MKRVFIGLLLISLCLVAIGQAPKAFNYQAIIRNSDGTIKAHETISLQVSITDEMGLVEYFEIHNTKTSSLGLVNVIIGEGTTTGDLGLIDWSKGPYYLNIIVNGVSLGFSPLLSVPYALYAERSGNDLSEIDYNEIINLPVIPSKTSELDNDAGFITQESDPDFNSSLAKNITSSDTTRWGTHFSGDYEDLKNKPPQFSGEYEDLENKPQLFTGDYEDLENKPQLFSRDYEDLINRPYALGDFSTELNGNTIREVGDPESDQDAVTLGYLNKVLIETLPTDKLLKAGFSFTELIQGGHSVADLLGDSLTLTELFERGVMVGSLEQGGVSEEELNEAGLAGQVSDFDSNDYKWVKIGQQIWMAENLEVLHLNDGTEIQSIHWNKENTSIWYVNFNNSSLPSYSWYTSPSISDSTNFGALYDMKCITSNKLCPIGWHVSTDSDWIILEDYLSGSSSAGGALKQAGEENWASPNIGATNESGFTALPGGGISTTDDPGLTSCGGIYTLGKWWSPVSSNSEEDIYVFRFLRNTITDVIRSAPVVLYDWSSTYGASVRCVKDSQ